MSRTPEELRALRQLAALLDTRFVIPGTSIRFGLDPLLSFIPGVGDLVSPAFAVLLMVQGVRQGVPKVVLVRMLVNAFVDALIGAVPIAGNIGDVFWRANVRNMGLLERHSRPGVRPAPADYVIVGVLAAAFGLVIFVPVLISFWLATALWAWLT
jgi:hypothetical protein